MNLLTFLAALFFLILALTIGGAVSWMMVAPIVQAFGKGSNKQKPTRSSRFQRKQNSKIRKADSLIEKKKFDDALKVLQKAFLISTPSDPEEIHRFKELNEDILSRVLLIAEDRGSKTEHLSEVEHCLLERVELLHLLSRARESFKSLRSRREKAGKEFPSWSRADFESRIKEIRSELLTNEKNLKQAVEVLFKQAKEPASEDSEPITYH